MTILERTSTVRPAPIVWTRLARAHVDMLLSTPDSPRRAVIVGSAGSGKSHLLRHIAGALMRDGVSVVAASACPDIAAVDVAEVLLVDDAHALDAAALEAVSDRVADPEAAVILACRPGVQSSSLTEITRRLETTRPAIVLGHVTREDVRAHVAERGGAITDACITAILHLCGDVTWIVTAALAIHDGTACDDPHHQAIRDGLQDVIAHRLRSIDPAVREAIELLCMTSDGDPQHTWMPGAHGLESAHAEGLLLRNGEPVPIVRDAVRATIPLARLIEQYCATADGTAGQELLSDALGGIRNPRIADALVRHGGSALPTDPRRAAHLLQSARDSGARADDVALLQAKAAWSLGEIDAAGAFLDEVVLDRTSADHDDAVDLAASIWAARGLMETSEAVYRSAPPVGGRSAARAAMVALAVADRDALLRPELAPPARTMPSTIAVSMELLRRGISTTLTGTAHDALNDVVRASEMYTVSGGDSPTPELPAVIAALLAINVGDLDVAQHVLEEAIRGGHGGSWAQSRLLLWRAWVAVQQERPHDAESSMQSALSSTRRVSPRDRLLADAIVVALARRYADLTGLQSAWRKARESILRAHFDLFSLQPLGEFVVTAVRVGDADRMDPHFTQALALMERLGSPPAWSAHLHWTGIQRGILLGRPDDLKPHAHALIAAARQSELAAMMAQAGRVWTSVLAGSVDPDVIEPAAYGLASVGLAWDGARLAGHGAGRTEDRRVISRLLACARQLHPREEAKTTDAGAERPAASTPRSSDALSAREREVAVLVLQGKTYAEIGEAIFISPRTAEHHIARIRGRLGATTRSDLIAKLRLVMEDAAEPHELMPENRRAAS